jgi:hypothetical protein
VEEKMSLLQIGSKIMLFRVRMKLEGLLNVLSEHANGLTKLQFPIYTNMRQGKWSRF